MIIIEGFDGTGKSWLAKELSKRLYMPVINRLRPKENIFIECIDTLMSSESYIIDRFHLSEEAYGPIKRGKSRFDFRQYKIVELSMLTQRTFNIYCRQDIDKIKQNFLKNTHEKQYPNEDEIEPIIEKFEEAIEKSLLDWHVYTWSDNVDTLVNNILSHSTNTPDLIRNIEKWKEYKTIGNLQGSVLIVGEKYGDKLLKPLVPFGNNEPGLKLFRAIDKSKLSWNDIIITNAFKHGLSEIDNMAAMKNELSLPNVKYVICLGNAAYEYVSSMSEIKSYNLKVYRLLHPSAAFAHQNMPIVEYAELLNQYDQ